MDSSRIALMAYGMENIGKNGFDLLAARQHGW
jgi:hypothetical protein